MALRDVGRAAWWTAKQPAISATRAGAATGRNVMAGGRTTGVLFGGAVAAGVTSAVLDRDGPYADLQEQAFGDRDAIRYSMQAGLKSAYDPSDEARRPGPMDYYYGRPVNVNQMAKNNRSSGSSTPVSGDLVFGMYNLRR